MHFKWLRDVLLDCSENPRNPYHFHVSFLTALFFAAVHVKSKKKSKKTQPYKVNLLHFPIMNFEDAQGHVHFPSFPWFLFCSNKETDQNTMP